VNKKEYFLPQSVDEATQILAEFGPSLLVMAGGTIAMPLINEGISFPENVMGLRRAGLDYVSGSNGTVQVGATATFTQIMEVIEIPMLAIAAQNIGGWAIRNMGTAGGNLFAPPPAGDFAVALLAMNAQVKLVSAKGERILPLADFYTGFMTTQLSAGELVAEIQVPKPSGRTAYIKYGRRHANTPAIVTVAAHLVFDGERISDARLVLGGVGPHPKRSPKAEGALVGSSLNAGSIEAAAAAAAAECEPFTDAIATEWYRRKRVDVYVGRTLSQVNG